MLDFLSDTQVLNGPEIAKILIVERDEAIREQLIAALSETGYEIQEAESVWEAFERLIDFSFDLMIGDANIPGTSNLELVRYCKKRHPSMEVVIVSKKPKLAEAVSLVKEGAFDYLQLPVEPEELRKKLREALGEQKNKLIRALTGYDISLDEHMMNPLPSCDIVKRLGAGSTGVVFLVKRHNEKYALKILRRDLSPKVAGKIESEQFLREAEILSGLNHQNIVNIFEYGISGNGVPYILMEYVHGHTLTKFIKKKVLGYKEKLTVLLQVCKALSFIHKNGVLHRDIKPGNIIISKEHVVKLADFGIAHMIDSDNTQPNEIMGSPAYMAPETFFKDEELDQSSDIFSLGVLAYELFTGKKPFQGDNVQQLIQAIKNVRPAEPRKLVPDLPEGIQDIFGQMLNKRREDRFKKVDDIIIALEEQFNSASGSASRRQKNIISMFIGGGGPRPWS